MQPAMLKLKVDDPEVPGRRGRLIARAKRRVRAASNGHVGYQAPRWDGVLVDIVSFGTRYGIVGSISHPALTDEVEIHDRAADWETAREIAEQHIARGIAACEAAGA